MKTSWGKRFALIFVALAMVQAVRTMTAMSNTVVLKYSGPAGTLVVSVHDADGARLRRTTFFDPDRSHTVKLPTGHYTAQLAIDGKVPVTRPFYVESDGTIELDYSGTAPNP